MPTAKDAERKPQRETGVRFYMGTRGARTKKGVRWPRARRHLILHQLSSILLSIADALDTLAQPRPQLLMWRALD
jgi:hypothetical protein